MAIDLETARPLRRPLDLQELVQAVVAAGSADEAFWVECKSNKFDLTKPEGRFNAARVILSFANRMPDTASTVCGGLAYLIIGAEPGKVDGTEVIDGADLDNGLIKYLGGDGPTWSPTYVKYADKDVLVIVVEAPKWGDRIHTLRQQLGNAQPGTVYIRSQSVSRQANPDEIRLLEGRLLRGQATPEIDGLQVDYTMGPPGEAHRTPEDIARWPSGVVLVNLTTDQVDEWTSSRRAAIRKYHQTFIDSMEKPKTKTLVAAMFSSPSVDEQAIEDHLNVCRQNLFDATRRDLIQMGLGLLTMTVTQPGRRTLEQVELTLTLKTPFSAFEHGHIPKHLKELPPPPPPPKPRLMFDTGLAALSDPFPSHVSTAKLQPGDYRLANRWFEISGSTITLTIGQLRPEKTGTSTDFHLFLHEPLPGDEVTIDWTLTTTSTEGVQRGSIRVPVLRPRGMIVAPTQGLPKDSAAE